MNVLIDALIGVRNLLHGNLIFGVGALLLAGFVGGKFAARLKLPTISGYIVAGLLLGPSILNVVPDHIVESLAPVPHIALGLIAITIGSEFRIAKLRKTGRNILIITTVQLLATFGAVAVALRFFGAPLPMALLLGAIASATAPAATVAIATELRARGPLVSTLFGVVALDDAFCITLFGFTMAFASAMVVGADGLGPLAMILHPLREIAISVAIGLAFGYVVHRLVINRKSNNEIIVIVLGFVLLTSGITVSIHVSPLMANMMMGFALVNLSPKNSRVMRVLEPLSPPIYAAFFALAGTELDVRTLSATGVLGVAYLIARASGLGFFRRRESPSVSFSYFKILRRSRICRTWDRWSTSSSLRSSSTRSSDPRLRSMPLRHRGPQDAAQHPEEHEHETDRRGYGREHRGQPQGADEGRSLPGDGRSPEEEPDSRGRR
jgi:Kef-type K+ transport system membrane component KefB